MQQGIGSLNVGTITNWMDRFCRELSVEGLHQLDEAESHNSESITDGFYDYYLQSNGGESSFYSAWDGSYTNVNAIDMGQEETHYIHEVYAELDLYLDLDFRHTLSTTKADARIELHHGYSDSLFEPTGYDGRSNTLTSAAERRRDYNPQTGHTESWNILWADMPDTEDRLSTYEKQAIKHEIAHTLGLSHPWNDPCNEGYSTADTIMSYMPEVGTEAINNSPYREQIWLDDSLYPAEYTALDIQAMQAIWGSETDFQWVEAAGSVDTVTDWKNRVAVLENDGSRHYVKCKGVAVEQSKELMVIGAETIKGINEVALQNSNGVISFWQCDDNWNFVRLNGSASFPDRSGYLAEIDFQQDMNDDGWAGQAWMRGSVFQD